MESLTEEAATSEMKRVRRGKKRLVFQPPTQMPPGVKDLWNRATAEERERAHRTMVVILEVWLAKTSRPEAAERLGIPPVRLHQLSQQATSGMLAGLLKQPRPRRVKPGTTTSRTDDPTSLKKENRRLEGELKEMKSLLSVLRDLPLSRPRDRGEDGRKPPRASGSKKSARGKGAARRAKLGEGSRGARSCVASEAGRVPDAGNGGAASSA
jgi:hypothetical protein